MVSLWWKQSQQQLKLVGFQCNSARDESFGELKLNGKAHQSLRIWEKNSSNRLNECTTTSSHWFWGNSLGQNDGSWSLSHCVLATYFTHTVSHTRSLTFVQEVTEMGNTPQIASEPHLLMVDVWDEAHWSNRTGFWEGIYTKAESWFC